MIITVKLRSHFYCPGWSFRTIHAIAAIALLLIVVTKGQLSYRPQPGTPQPKRAGAWARRHRHGEYLA